MTVNFKEWLIINSTGDVLTHAKRSKFPGTKSYKKIRAYLNKKYKGSYLDDEIIEKFNNLLDQYEQDWSVRNE